MEKSLKRKKKVMYYTYCMIPFIYYKIIYIYIKIYTPILVQTGTQRQTGEGTGTIKRNFNIKLLLYLLKLL